MKTIKKILVGVLFMFSLIFSSCTDELESIVPDVETSESLSAEGTGGVEVDPD